MLVLKREDCPLCDEISDCLDCYVPHCPYVEDVDTILEPCPFCGGKPGLIYDTENDGNAHYKVARIECQSCGCRTKNYTVDGYYGAETTELDAVLIWNDRVY